MTHENHAPATRALQRYLRTLSYFNNNMNGVPIDGVFDSATEQAVLNFQKAQGLPQTGRVDQATFELLYKRFLEEQERRAAPARISHFPRLPENYTVEMGDTQFLVQIIQHALQELAVSYLWDVQPPLSGVYDSDTAAAVKKFQQANGLPATGNVDLFTWNALANAYNRQFAGYVSQ